MAAYTPLLRHRWQASSLLVKWPLSLNVTRPNRFAFAAAHEFALQGFVTGITPFPHACAATLMNGLFQR